MRAAVPILLLLVAAPAFGQTAAPSTGRTLLPPPRDGVIRPDTVGQGRDTDPRMPVLRPKMAGRMPVIRPPSGDKGNGPAIDPR